MKNSFEADKNEKNNLHLQDLANNSFIQVSQVRTRMFGRCHTIMFKSKVRKISDFQRIKFKRNIKICNVSNPQSTLAPYVLPFMIESLE